MADKHTRQREQKPEQEGDVLGISQAKGEIPRPRHLVDGGGRPKGIDVGPGADRDDGQLDGSPGMSSTDMGAGGSGNTIRHRR